MGGFRPQGGIPNPVPTPASPPPRYCFRHTSSNLQKLSPCVEVETMISKGALERVPDPGPGFYSCLFLVEKCQEAGDP